MRKMTRRAFGVAGIAVALTATASLAQQPERVRIRGTLEKIDGQVLSVKSREGANVVINYHRNETAAKEVKTAAEAGGVRAIVVQADVSSVPDIERLYDAAIEEFGQIDIVVANAGMEKVNIPFTDGTEEDFDCVHSRVG